MKTSSSRLMLIHDGQTNEEANENKPFEIDVLRHLLYWVETVGASGKTTSTLPPSPQ